MVSEPRLDEAQLSEIAEGVVALATSPFVLLASAAVKQPAVQTAIKEGVALSERLKETAAETSEIFEDLVAEARNQLVQERSTELGENQNWSRTGDSEVAHGLVQMLSTLDEEIGRTTNGIVDLRMLMPLGLGALAVRQLLVKGLQIDEIPWYTMAWYAFDSFIKLNHSDVRSTLYPTSKSEMSQEPTSQEHTQN